MIHSILDNDLYKFSMQNAVIKHFPRAKVRFEFINRGGTKFPDGFAEALRREIKNLEYLELSPEEKSFLENKCPYLDPTYLDFLNGYSYNSGEVGVIQKGGEIMVSIEGYWYRTILWEVPLMAMISELYFKQTEQEADSEKQIAERTRKKAAKFKMLGANVADFGTRRRYSYDNHRLVVKELKEYGGKSFTGTSNVHFAHQFNLTPIGTHAHEWFMFHAAKYGFKIANKIALENWVKTYRGDLGIALSDTYTTDVFFKSFDKKFAKLFDGVRHDSGNAIVFANKTIEHYKSLGINPLDKSIIFSDGLNPDKLEEIESHCRGKVKTAYGIGTNLTNDVGLKPLNIVIKIVEALPEGQERIPTVKLSDEKGKHTGDSEAVELCKEVLRIK